LEFFILTPFLWMIKDIGLLISDEFCVSKIQLFFLKDRYKIQPGSYFKLIFGA